MFFIVQQVWAAASEFICISESMTFQSNSSFDTRVVKTFPIVSHCRCLLSICFSIDMPPFVHFLFTTKPDAWWEMKGEASLGVQWDCQHRREAEALRRESICIESFKMDLRVVNNSVRIQTAEDWLCFLELKRKTIDLGLFRRLILSDLITTAVRLSISFGSLGQLNFLVDAKTSSNNRKEVLSSCSAELRLCK